MWKKTLSLSELNRFCQNSAVSHLGIEFTAQTAESLTAVVPVDARTCQPFGLLHGGVSAALAETVVSAAAMLSCNDEQLPVGSELNISHLKAIKNGKASACATPLHLGSSSQVWQVEIRNPQNELCAVARVAVRLLDKK